MSNEINKDTEYGGGDIINRFAITGLSKKYNEQALNEEIMIEKSTGEFLIKNLYGVTISYDALARRRSTITDATEAAVTQNMIGDMYELALEEYDLPAIIPYEKNILDNTISLSTNLKKMLFFMDIDEIVKKTLAEVSEVAPIVEIGLRCGIGNTYNDIIIRKPLNQFNNNIIDVEKTINRPGDNYSVILTSIKFIKQSDEKIDTFIILHNMVLTIF